MSTRRRAAPVAAQSTKLRREDTWAGLRVGELVEVTGTGIRSARWEFVAHVTNVTSGEDWIEVVGGAKGDRQMRSFAPERVFAITANRKHRGPSLADAPRLPLA